LFALRVLCSKANLEPQHTPPALQFHLPVPCSSYHAGDTLDFVYTDDAGANKKSTSILFQPCGHTIELSILVLEISFYRGEMAKNTGIDNSTGWIDNSIELSIRTVELSIHIFWPFRLDKNKVLRKGIDNTKVRVDKVIVLHFWVFGPFP